MSQALKFHNFVHACPLLKRHMQWDESSHHSVLERGWQQDQEYLHPFPEQTYAQVQTESRPVMAH